MRLICLVTIMALLALPGAAQRQRLATINTETPEGQMLQQIGQEEDASAKLGLLEKFAAQYPNHEAKAWVYAQLLAGYSKQEQHAKVLDAGEKLLQADPGDVESAHAALKSAEALKDATQIRKWAVLTSEAARKEAASTKSEDEEEDEWKRRVDFAKQVDVYAEYALFAAFAQVQDPAQRVELFETLEQRNPGGQYAQQLRTAYYMTLKQTGAHEKAAQVAEKVLASDPDNEDMLLALADYHMNQKKDDDKVLSYSKRLVDVMKTKPAPQGVSAEDWEKKKGVSVGLGHWMAGVTHGSNGRHSQADDELRDALPLIKHNEQLLAAALFYLGVANFRMGEKGPDQARLIDALRFSQQCAAIKSPFQAQAQKNVNAIRSQYRFR